MINFYYTDLFYKYVSEEQLDNIYRMFAVVSNTSFQRIEPQQKSFGALDIMVSFLNKENIARLDDRHMYIIFYNDLDKELVILTKSILKNNLLGFVNINDDLSHFNGFINDIKNNLVIGDENTSITKSMLEALYSESLSELERLKKIHSNTVPMRMESFKNLNVYSKFASGTNRGGEFFDLIKNDNEVLIVIASFSSYLGTSLIMKQLESLKINNNFSDDRLNDFLEDFTDACRDISMIEEENFETLQLDIIRINLTDLAVNGYHFGAGSLYKNVECVVKNNEFILNENNFNNSKYKFNLLHSDRLFYFSPGVLKNLKQVNRSISTILKKYSGVGIKEMINEFVYLLKSESKNDFLDNDSSLIFIEVNKNAIIQI